MRRRSAAREAGLEVRTETTCAITPSAAVEVANEPTKLLTTWNAASISAKRKMQVIGDLGFPIAVECAFDDKHVLASCFSRGPGR